MTDTPSNIKALQLEIWLSKTPMERLRQMMEDNEALIKFWASIREINSDSRGDNPAATSNSSTSH